MKFADKMKKYILLISMLAVVVSCGKEDGYEEPRVGSKTGDNKVIESVLYTGNTVYSKAFYVNAPKVGYSSLKEHSLAKEQLTPLGSEEELKLKSNDMSKVMVSVNGHDLMSEERLLKSYNTSNEISLLEELYGSDVEFIIRKSSQLKSGSTTTVADTIDMYIPKLVQITSPEIKTEEELYPHCYYKNFTLYWNADECNANGLVVLAEWYGTKVTGERSKQYVRNIDVILEDDGEEMLNDQLFDNIPEDALMYLTLLRGNIELSDIDSATYRVLGETHAVLPMILVRELDGE